MKFKPLFAVCPEGTSTLNQWISYKPGREVSFNFVFPFSRGSGWYSGQRMDDHLTFKLRVGWKHSRFLLVEVSRYSI